VASNTPKRITEDQDYMQFQVAVNSNDGGSGHWRSGIRVRKPNSNFRITAAKAIASILGGDKVAANYLAI
jgi:hypothetical protein